MNVGCILGYPGRSWKASDLVTYVTGDRYESPVSYFTMDQAIWPFEKCIPFVQLYRFNELRTGRLKFYHLVCLRVNVLCYRITTPLIPPYIELCIIQTLVLLNDCIPQPWTNFGGGLELVLKETSVHEIITSLKLAIRYFSLLVNPHSDIPPRSIDPSKPSQLQHVCETDLPSGSAVKKCEFSSRL